MPKSDFAEPKNQNNFGKFNLNYNWLSKRYGRVLELMEIEAVMIDWDYQLLLLLKRIEVLPDNRMAAKHMQSLKKRFDRERKFFDCYKSFIDELLVKEDASKWACASSHVVFYGSS